MKAYAIYCEITHKVVYVKYTGGCELITPLTYQQNSNRFKLVKDVKVPVQLLKGKAKKIK
jgi:hypothetical protein